MSHTGVGGLTLGGGLQFFGHAFLEVLGHPDDRRGIELEVRNVAGDVGPLLSLIQKQVFYATDEGLFIPSWLKNEAWADGHLHGLCRFFSVEECETATGDEEQRCQKSRCIRSFHGTSGSSRYPSFFGYRTFMDVSSRRSGLTGKETNGQTDSSSNQSPYFLISIRWTPLTSLSLTPETTSSFASSLPFSVMAVNPSNG